MLAWHRVGYATGKLGDSAMYAVWLRLDVVISPPSMPSPTKRWGSLEGFGGGELCRIEVLRGPGQRDSEFGIPRFADAPAPVKTTIC